MAPGAPRVIMGVVVDLQARRLGIEIDPIQSGMETVARYLEVDTPCITDAHQGYGMLSDTDEQAVSIGKAGLHDFQGGFEGILPETANRTASFAYGAFYAGKLLLPEVVMSTPSAARRFTMVVDESLKHNPDTDFPVMAEFTTARAAATITIMALWGTFRDQGPEARLEFSRRVRTKTFPPSNEYVAFVFNRRLNERVLLRILDKPDPRTK